VPVRRCLAGAKPWTAERLPAGFLVGTLARRTSAASAFCRPAKNLNLKETVMYGYPSDFIINE